MEAIIQKLLQPDNAVIEAGTRELKVALSSPHALPELCSVLTAQTASPEVRQYAAVLLRKKFGQERLWLGLSGEQRGLVRQGCLNALENEGQASVRQAIVQLVGVLARREPWPELRAFIVGWWTSEQPERRVWGVRAWSVVCQEAGARVRPELAQFAPLLQRALSQEGPDMAFYAIQALQALVPHMGSEELPLVQPLMAHVIAALPPLVRADQDRAARALELFDDLFESEVPIVAPHLAPIVELCMNIAAQNDLDDSLRVPAITLLGRLVRLKKKAVIKQKLHGPMINTLFPIMCYVPEDPEDEAADMNESAHPSTCACQALDCLAIQLPPEKFMPPLLRLVEPALQDGRPEMLKGAFNALAVIAEGCSEHIRTKYMVSFLQAIGQGIKHAHPSVKNAALYALGQFSEYLQPEINNYASDILPVLFEFLDEASQQMKQTRRDPPGLDRIFYALEIFCENLEKKLEPFLPELMNRLLGLLQGEEISVRTQELAISAIGAASNATGQAIYPFFDPIMVNLKRYLNLTSSSEQELTLLTQSMDTLGTLARAVGPTGFVPSLAEECCQLSLDLVTKYDDPDVRKCAFAMFGSVSFVVKDQGIGEVLPGIIDLMIRSVESKEGISFEYKDEGDSHLPLEDLSDEEEDDGEISLNSSSNASNLKAVNVENAFMEEKEQAVIALKDICQNSPNSFYPYLQKSSEVIWGVLEFPDEDVRKSAAEALAEFARCYFKMGTPQGQEAFQNAITALVPKLCSLVQTDPEAGVVSTCLDQLAYLLKECHGGVAGIPGYPEMIIKCVQLVMKSECACMDAESCFGSELEDEDIQSEQDDVLFEYAGEVLPALGNAMNPAAFSPYFAGMLPHLLKKTKKSCTVSERSFGAGSLADCMKPLQGALDPYISTLFPVFLTLLKDDEDDVRNNAIFGLGELAHRSGPGMYEKYPTILQTLSNILAIEENPRVIDQILGAVCRLLVTNIDLVPLEEVLPVVFRNLPLKEDEEENTIILKAILLLYAKGHPQVRQNVAKIMEVAVTAFKTGDEAVAEDNELAKIVLNNLSQDMPEDFRSTLNAFPENIASKIVQIIQAD